MWRRNMMKNSAKIEFLEHKLIEFLEDKFDEVSPSNAGYLPSRWKIFYEAARPGMQLLEGG